jgi:hypothetical protein
VQHPSADSNGSLAHFFKNLNLLGRVRQHAAANNGCLPRFKFKKAQQMANTITQKNTVV